MTNVMRTMPTSQGHHSADEKRYRAMFHPSPQFPLSPSPASSLCIYLTPSSLDPGSLSPQGTPAVRTGEEGRQVGAVGCVRTVHLSICLDAEGK